MRTRDFKKLKEGQRVSVTGVFEGEVFSSDTGVIIPNNLGAYYDLKIRFDKWRGSTGHGAVQHNFCFRSAEAADFKITVLPEAPKAEPAKPAATKKRPHGAQEYKGNGKHSWETVVSETTAGEAIVRLRVPGGWLYATQSLDNYEITSTMTFVPVPEAVGYAV